MFVLYNEGSWRNNMRIGLVSYRCENRNILFNMQQVELAMKQSLGKVDLLCFGEAFLQGFDALSWNYDEDQLIALEQSSETITQLKDWTIQYGISLITGYIEKQQDKLYSSCIVISDGEIIHNYRRISKGWKESSKTDHHYCEGDTIRSFHLYERNITLALCGDLWDYPDRFKTNDLLIWPVYVDFTLNEWNSGTIDEYASQASLVAKDTLMINPIDNNPINHGGSFHFHNGQTISRIPFDEEDILIVKI